MCYFRKVAAEVSESLRVAMKAELPDARLV